MRHMDTKQVDELLTDLEGAEPAEAADLADRVAALLGDLLDPAADRPEQAP